MSTPAKLNPNYGKGEHTIDAQDPEDASHRLCMRLLTVFRNPKYTPPKLPQVGVELLEMSRRPDVDLNQVLKLLEKDALLAASVLKVARSPAFAGSMEVVSLHQALVRLGLKTLTEIVLQATMDLEVFRAPGYEETMEQLSKHSAVTAHLTRFICSASDVPNDYAFLCGLMLDIGVAASLAVIAHRRRQPPALSQVWAGIDEASPEAGAVVAQAWNLPAQVAEVIRLHRQVVVDGKVHRVAAATALADGFAIEAGYGVAEQRAEDGTRHVEYAARFLNMESKRLDRLRKQAHHLAHAVEV